MDEKSFSEGEKFPAAKKKIAAKISCGKNSSDKISIGKILRDEERVHWNLMRRKFHAAKLNAAKISRGEISCGEISDSEI